MTPDLLRVVVAGLACLTAGSTLVVAVRYAWAAYRLRATPGRLLVRHVSGVSLGTCGLVVGYAVAVAEPLGFTPRLLVAETRLWLYLVSMLLLLTAIIDVGRHTRQRSDQRPDRPHESGRHHKP